MVYVSVRVDVYTYYDVNLLSYIERQEEINARFIFQLSPLGLNNSLIQCYDQYPISLLHALSRVTRI